MSDELGDDDKQRFSEAIETLHQRGRAFRDATTILEARDALRAWLEERRCTVKTMGDGTLYISTSHADTFLITIERMKWGDARRRIDEIAQSKAALQKRER